MNMTQSMPCVQFESLNPFTSILFDFVGFCTVFALENDSKLSLVTVESPKHNVQLQLANLRSWNYKNITKIYTRDEMRWY